MTSLYQALFKNITFVGGIQHLMYLVLYLYCILCLHFALACSTAQNIIYDIRTPMTFKNIAHDEPYWQHFFSKIKRTRP